MNLGDDLENAFSRRKQVGGVLDAHVGPDAGLKAAVGGGTLRVRLTEPGVRPVAEVVRRAALTAVFGPLSVGLLRTRSRRITPHHGYTAPVSGLYRALVLLELALAVLTFVGLRFVSAPYGRYERRGWGPTVPARAGWMVMEAPAALLFAGVYALGAHRDQLVPLVLLALWQAHYLHRAFVYPFLLRGRTRMPVTIVLMAIGFNVLNAWINATAVSELGDYPVGWLADPRFLVGVVLFVGGLAINRGADRTLRRLRSPGETGYKIPTGGAYRWVSCPNYLGEIVEWFGWALATWSAAGLAFAVYTTANLAPRALDHHRWYREHFPDYPPSRRALVPFVI